MTHKENWLDKKFEFDFPVTQYVVYLQFLRETPAKIEKLIQGLSSEELIRKNKGSWSIQENVGHFLTAESLFLGRLDDYANNASVLRPARFEDNPTDKANFNASDIKGILNEFRNERAVYTRRLDALDLEDFEKAIMHPRLNKPMRLCDMLYFHAKHDQHHLSRINELIELWQEK